MVADSQLCKDLEAFETDPWAAKAILEVEIMTPLVIDPCCGTGILTMAARDSGYNRVHGWDIKDWSPDFGGPPPEKVFDFFDPELEAFWPNTTIFCNPPFSTACEFVDRAKSLGARKIICFQRWAWRESIGRRKWWADNPPARTWICGERATCWRFDVPKTCVGEACGKGQGRGTNALRCRQCMQGTPTSHGWFVWEQGHMGAGVTNDLWKVPRSNGAALRAVDGNNNKPGQALKTSAATRD